MGDLVVYVLTHAGAGARRQVAGLDAGCELVEQGGVAAVVRRLTGRRPTPSRSNLLACHHLIEALARELAAVLPVRFPTIMGRDELQSLLRAREAGFRRGLRLVRHRAQMTVRVSGSVAPPPVAVSPRARATAPANPRKVGTAFLVSRAAEAARARAVPAFDPLRPAVRRWVRAEHVEPGIRVSTIHHLIPRRAAGPYRRALEMDAVARGITLHVSGPMPAYAFASLDPVEWP